MATIHLIWWYLRDLACNHQRAAEFEIFQPGVAFAHSMSQFLCDVLVWEDRFQLLAPDPMASLLQCCQISNMAWNRILAWLTKFSWDYSCCFCFFALWNIEQCIDIYWQSTLLILRKYLSVHQESLWQILHLYGVFTVFIITFKFYIYNQTAELRLKMAIQTPSKLLPELDKAVFYHCSSSLWPSTMLCDEHHASGKRFIILTKTILVTWSLQMILSYLRKTSQNYNKWWLP